MNNSYLPITILPIQSFQENTSVFTIQISYSLSQYWKLEKNKPLYLKIGLNKIVVTLEISNITKNEMYFSQNIFIHFQLPIQELKLLAHYSKSVNTIYLGPIIGLLTEIVEIEENGLFRSIETFCQELHVGISNIGGLFYVFQIQDFSKNNILAYHYEDNQWKKRIFPHPNIIYNRIHSRKLESCSLFQDFKNQLNKLNIPIYNDSFLSKELIHTILSKEEHMKSYLPETVILSENNLKNMAEKHYVLFIKPIHGSQGKNIIRISREGEEFIVEFSSGKSQGNQKKFSSINPLLLWLKHLFKNKNYLCQEGIPFKTFDHRPLDFRVLCHKNYQNNWKVTSVVARLSAENQFVSNIARGGEIMNPLNILSSLFDQNMAFQQYALMYELAIETATIISQNQNGTFAELGIDIGVDEKGEIWIIEVNSKPSKRFEEFKKKIRPSAKAIIEYCITTSFQGMTDKENEK